jgi:hypothetical protein
MEGQTRQLAIRERDFARFTTVALMRLPTAKAEEERIRCVGKVLAAARRLLGALEIQTRYATVDHRGTLGSNDLARAGQNLFHALEDYAGELDRLAEYESGLREPSIEPISALRIVG